MAVSLKWYGLGLQSILNGIVDFDTDTIKVSLHTDSYLVDQDTDDYWDDCDNEVVGAGYTHEGATLASASIGYTAGTNVLKLDGDDITWGSASITARYAVVYVREAADADSPVIGYADFGEDIVSGGGDFVITWHADGMLTITAD